MPRLRVLPVLFTIVSVSLVVGVPDRAQAEPRQSQAAAPSVVGTVTDGESLPLSRVRVRLIGPQSTELASALSDAAGRFTLVLPASSCQGCRVEADRVGFVATSVPVSAGPTVVLRLTVAPLRESVVVTATRGEAPASLAGASVTVIERDEIERRGAPMVSDLLKSTPSVAVVRTGGIGNVTSLFVRGGESDYNKVLLDGIPLNEPGGTFNFSNLTTNHLERVEVVRGAMSALFGSDAMSSVIQLVSRRGTPGAKPDLHAEIEAASYDTTRLQGGISGGAGRWDYSVSAGQLRTDNRVPNNAFDNTTWVLGAGGPIGRGDQFLLRAVARVEEQRVGVPGQTSFGRPDRDAFFDRTDVVGGVSVEHRGNRGWTQRGGFSVSRSGQRSANLIEDAPYTPTFEGRTAPFTFFDFLLDSRNTLRRYTATYQSDWALGSSSQRRAQIVTAAIDLEWQRATLRDVLAESSLSAERNNAGLTLQHQFVSARLSTTASLRVERNASFGTAVVPRGAVALELRRNGGAWGDTLLRGSGGLGIKEPTILESFSKNPFFLANPDLEPERSASFDVGLVQRLLSQRIRLELTWFDARYRNQISTQTIDPATFRSQYFNIGRTRARGTELAVEASLPGAIELRAGHTFLVSEIVDSTSPSSAVFRAGAWTFRRPRHSGFLTLTTSIGRVGLDLSGVFSGRRVDSDFASLAPPILESNLPALWTLGIRGRLSRQLEGYLRFENLTDQEYMDPPGYPAWRRSAHAGVRVGF